MIAPRVDRAAPERHAAAGISLAEVLVAITVLALAMTVALRLYDSSRRAFEVGENVTEQQQVVRIAFDRLTTRIRMAGFNLNPDGDRGRMDEGIEAAFATALIVRADYDGDDPSDATDPESTLAGDAFRAVSTGNDELVGYYLVKRGAGAGDVLQFEADLGDAPRDGHPEAISVSPVALDDQDDPPYTLYRVTFGDPGTCCGDGFAVRAPIADNLRSLRFRYFDASGVEVAPPGGGDDDVSRQERSRIRRIGLEIEGLTRDPDPTWEDEEDDDPSTRGHRKFRLAADVTPLNLGRFTMRDFEANLTPPQPPSRPDVYPGHCKGLFVTWPPNAAQDEVAQYRVHFGTSPPAAIDVMETRSTEAYIDGLEHGTEYYVWIEAVDDSGYVGAWSPNRSATTTNDNIPEVPTGLTVTPDPVAGGARIAWDPVTENTDPVPAADPQLRDLAGYRLYRSDFGGFEPDISNRIADYDVLPDTGSPEYQDLWIARCRAYHYRVKAIDTCQEEGDASPPVDVTLPPGAPPQAPVNLQSFLLDDSIMLTWDEVRQDTAGVPTYIDNYRVYQGGPVPIGHLPPPLELIGSATPPGATSYEVPISLSDGQTVYFQVQAMDPCGLASGYSNVTQPFCAFSGLVTITQPPYGAIVSGGTTVSVDVTAGLGSYTGLTLEFLHLDSGDIETHAFSGGPPWAYTWNAGTQAGDGTYVITATVIESGGDDEGDCSQTRSIKVGVGGPIE